MRKTRQRHKSRTIGKCPRTKATSVGRQICNHGLKRIHRKRVANIRRQEKTKSREKLERAKSYSQRRITIETVDKKKRSLWRKIASKLFKGGKKK